MSDDFGSSIFSEAEKHMGVDAYQSMVKMQTAQVEAAKAVAMWVDAKTNTLRTVCLIAFITMLPVWVWLWKWAL